MKIIIFAFFILFSLNSVGQTKGKSIYIEIRDSSNVFIQKSNDSLLIIYDVFVKNDKYPFKLANERKSDESLKVISNFEYQKLQKQILSNEFVSNLTNEEFLKIIEGNKIYVIDFSDRKMIKKVLVKNIDYIIPD